MCSATPTALLFSLTVSQGQSDQYFEFLSVVVAEVHSFFATRYIDRQRALELKSEVDKASC